ncbi:inactive leucine-rich repeat receptor-like protein kinase CORYNE isoform X2 [Herrania umbratica]|uniref:Inactive leucine-rich repeat receptor-like protein kinase CORYNE isoform X2 n=1 Tax=Herrania umbratica TaxID=108875 RepID=A0A6J1BFA7_9ROSI|nr:inactive leucine-rich repeat receptor-like protein kinase CORYNE isoform X2 [Herrania umbratica]
MTLVFVCGFVASMEKRSCTLSLLLLLLLCFHLTTVQCEGRLIRHLSSLPPSLSTPQEFKIGFKRIILSIALGILTGLIGAILFALLIKFAVQYMNQTPILKGPVIFSPKISAKTLQSALSTENQLLGSSSNGKYYKTVLDNGLTVAVKVLEPFDNGSPERHSKSVKRRIQQELEILASLRHRHLMSLRAYVRESDRFSLVYDYMPTGSLEDAMNRVRGNQLQLGWDVRLRIAVGVIKGLQYLHFTCIPQILHYNLKPTNVMLDAELEPRLADCGLAKLMPNIDRATSGYGAPECFENCRYTDKSDIFSFGMILGVLLTGRDPTDPFFGEAASGGSLGQWLRHLQQAGEAREALDKSIVGEEVEEDEMLMAVRIAVVCLSDLPADRPSSDELVPMLTQLHSF